MIKGLHHYSMKCGTQAEFDRAKDFYMNVLGFNLVREWAEGVMIDAGNCLVEIFNNDLNINSRGTIRHVAFAVDDVDGIISRVRQAGYEVFVEPKDVVIRSEPSYPARVAFCYGALGEEIEFFQER